MGQKIHPTGFRVGINQAYQSRWFATYSNYNIVLKEDYNIRTYFKKDLALFYNKAGISKIKIYRKKTQLEILIYAARPKNILPVTLTLLRKSIKKKLFKPGQVSVQIIQTIQNENISILLALDLAEQLEKRVTFRKAIRYLTQKLKQTEVKGFKVQVSGRLNGAEMARTEWIREGRVPLQTIRADIKYATARAHTIYGVLGIKIWIFKQELL